MSDEQARDDNPTGRINTPYSWQSSAPSVPERPSYSWVTSTTIGDRREGFRALPVPAITQPLPPPSKLPPPESTPACQHVERLADIKGEYRAFLLGMILFFAFIALVNAYVFFSTFAFVALVGAVGSVSASCVATWKRVILTEQDDS